MSWGDKIYIKVEPKELLEIFVLHIIEKMLHNIIIVLES